MQSESRKLEGLQELGESSDSGDGVREDEGSMLGMVEEEGVEIEILRCQQCRELSWVLVPFPLDRIRQFPLSALRPFETPGSRQ